MAGTRRGKGEVDFTISFQNLLFSFAHSPHSLPGSRASSTPRHGRGQNPLARAPAQDIPDIYWEQAARELDFCTCRKCQVTLVRVPSNVVVMAILQIFSPLNL